MIFPWQMKQWQQLCQLKQTNRLPHALLFTGLSGVGKAKLAEHFSAALLCQHHFYEKIENTFEQTCECHSCRLIASHVHPNVLWITPEKEGHAIKVDQIREINEFVNQSSLQGGYRFVIIHPANSMNMNAANALLKTLEEPAADAIMILVSHSSSYLPATILSRCQRLIFSKPQPEIALAWLKKQLMDDKLNPELLLHLAHGAPLAALQLKEKNLLVIRDEILHTLWLLSQQQGDPLKLAAKIQDIDTFLLLDVILSWIIDLLRIQLNASLSEITNKDCAKQLTDLKQSTSLQHNLCFMNHLQHLRGEISKGINLNKLLMLESLFIRWMKYVSR